MLIIEKKNKQTAGSDCASLINCTKEQIVLINTSSGLTRHDLLLIIHFFYKYNLQIQTLNIRE